MYIEAIEILDFRTLRGHTCIDSLTRGLNLIEGANETGKSTLVDAIQTVLFQRHRVSGQIAKRMLPFGSQVRPTIELRFSIAGSSYLLRKAYCQQPEALLEGPSVRYRGTAAEDALEALLGIQIPKRGPSRPEHRGVWSLFILDQGSTILETEPNQAAETKLRSALDREVEDALHGDVGQRLMQRIESRLAGWVGKKGVPVGAYRKRLQHLQEAKTELESVRALLAEYDSRQNALEQQQRDATSMQDRIAELEVQAAKAEAFQQRALSIKEKKEHAQKHHAEAVRTHQRFFELHQQRKSQVETFTASEHKIAALLAEHESIKRHVPHRECTRLETELGALKAEQATALERRSVAQLSRDRALCAHELSQLKERLRKLEAASKQQRHLELRLRDNPITEACYRKLERLRDAALRVQHMLVATSTRVDLSGYEGEVRLAGVLLDLKQPLLLDQSATLELGTLGSIVIHPGGEDRRREQEAGRRYEAEYQAALAELGLSSVDDVRVAYERRRSDENELASLAQVIDAHAPIGIDMLREELQRSQGVWHDLSQDSEPEPQLQLGLTDGDGASISLAEAQTQLSTSEDACREISQKIEYVQAELTRTRALLSTLDQQLASLQGQREAESRHLHQAKQTYAEAQQDLSNSVLDETLRGASAERQAREQEVLELEKQWREGLFDTAAEQWTQAKKNLEACRDQDQQLRLELSRHRAFLAGSGQTGLGERQAELEQTVMRLGEQNARDERERRSLTLLDETLKSIAKRNLDRFQAPLQKRMQRYVDRIFPGQTLQLSSRMTAVGLERSTLEPFETLSYGTREQLAILSRLSFAEILAEEGTPPPVILDDAPAHSDDPRFGQLLHLLQSAAEKTQILILTCRPSMWRLVKAHRVSLAACRDAQAGLPPLIASHLRT